MAILSFFVSFPVPRWLSFPCLSLLHFFPLVWYLSLLFLFSFLYFLAFPLSSPIPVPHHFSPLSWYQLHAPALWLATTLSLRTNHYPPDPPYNNVSTCSWHSWIALPMKMGLIGCPKMSVTSCWPMLCNIPQEWRPELLHGTCLISFTVIKVLWKKPRVILIVIINYQLLAHTVYVQLLVFNNNNNKYKLHLLNNIKRRVCSCSLNVMSCILCCFPDFLSGKE